MRTFKLANIRTWNIGIYVSIAVSENYVSYVRGYVTSYKHVSVSYYIN